MKSAINRHDRNTIQLSGRGNLSGTFRAFWRQTIELLPQLQQGISRDSATTAAHNFPAPGRLTPSRSRAGGRWPWLPSSQWYTGARPLQDLGKVSFPGIRPEPSPRHCLPSGAPGEGLFQTQRKHPAYRGRLYLLNACPQAVLLP